MKGVYIWKKKIALGEFPSFIAFCMNKAPVEAKWGSSKLIENSCLTALKNQRTYLGTTIAVGK